MNDESKVVEIILVWALHTMLPQQLSTDGRSPPPSPSLASPSPASSWASSPTPSWDSNCSESRLTTKMLSESPTASDIKQRKCSIRRSRLPIQTQTDNSESGVLFRSQLIDANSITPYSDATQVSPKLPIHFLQLLLIFLQLTKFWSRSKGFRYVLYFYFGTEHAQDF